MRSTEMNTKADLTASTALANEMAAALAGTFPRVRIGQLEPCEQVARGVFALMKERVAAFEREYATTYPGTIYPSAVQREEVRIAVLTECLVTWQACTMEAAIDKWLCADSGPALRKVEFWQSGGKHNCWLVENNAAGAPVTEYFGQGDVPSLALAAALEAFDAGEDEDGGV